MVKWLAVEIISYCDDCFKGTRFDSSAPPAEVACSKCGGREVDMVASGGKWRE